MAKNRLFVLLMLLMSVGLLAQAAPVTQEQARQEASRFLLNKQKSNHSLKFATKGNKTLEAAASNEAAYYVFNIGNNQGFVIVAGDDRINPILGYSDEGYFDEAKAPANMKAWLNDYAPLLKPRTLWTHATLSPP